MLQWHVAIDEGHEFGVLRKAHVFSGSKRVDFRSGRVNVGLMVAAYRGALASASCTDVMRNASWPS